MNCVFQYNPRSFKTTVTNVTSRTLVLSSDLQQLLGLPGEIGGERTVTGDYTADMTRHFHTLYIYCNIVKPRRVGDTAAKLLRTVPVHIAHGDVWHQFALPQFYEAEAHEEDTVEIYITTHTGSPAPFLDGEVTATLLLESMSK